MLSMEACERSAVKKKKYMNYIHPRRKELEKGLEISADDTQASGEERVTVQQSTEPSVQNLPCRLGTTPP